MTGLIFQPEIILLITTVVFFSAVVKGITGFGYATISTSILALFINPTTAVVLMIVPDMFANFTLVTTIDTSRVKEGVVTFWPHLLTGLVGAVVGMLIHDVVSEDLMHVILGVMVLLYVVAELEIFYKLKKGIKVFFSEGTPTQVGMGSAGGLVFGSANIDILAILYYDGVPIDKEMFVAMVVVFSIGVDLSRIISGFVFGIIPHVDFVLLSVGVGLAGVVGTYIGSKTRKWVSVSMVNRIVLALLVFVGLKLAYDGIF
ncbi:MAG: sulfite exporter TauE/SafE family protein [Halobacteria archaeon]